MIPDIDIWRAAALMTKHYGDSDCAATLMKPANEDVLVERLVSKAVGNVKNNGPELLASAE